MQLWSLIDAQREWKLRMKTLSVGLAKKCRQSSSLLSSIQCLMSQYEARTWQIVPIQLRLRLKLVDLGEFEVNGSDQTEPYKEQEQMNEPKLAEPSIVEPSIVEP